ncbi:MAG: hypothetical protein AAGG06_04550 [Pseudomonadota bacterium]
MAVMFAAAATGAEGAAEAAPLAARAYVKYGYGGAGVPPDRLPPRGLCRIWYDELPPDRQPPSMGCRQAKTQARRYGGRVIFRPVDGEPTEALTIAVYDGFNDFRGVPPDRLPYPGRCRVWIEGVSPDRQPPNMGLRRARAVARHEGGRVLCMPGG